MTCIIFWACVVAVSIIIEIQSVNLVSIWFAGGGIVSLLLATLGVGEEWQVIVFFVTSFVLLVAFRSLMKKFLKSPSVPTNADAYFGQHFKLLGDVVGGRSTVKINDVVWTVQVNDALKTGDVVILKGISGNKYIAESLKGD